MRTLTSAAGAGRRSCDAVSLSYLEAVILLETYLNHVRSHEANATSPAGRRVVEHVVHAEARVLTGELVQVLLQKNVLLVDVCEDEVDLGLISGSSASEDSLGDLQHGSDTGTASNHTEVPHHVGSVNHGALGALDLQLVADLESCEVTADVTGGVALDEQVDIAGLNIGGDGGVGAHDFLVGNGLGLGVLDIEVGGDRDVLANGQAEDAVRGGQGEAVDSGVVGEDSLLGERELLEDGGVKDLLLLCESGVSEVCWMKRSLGCRTISEDLVASKSSADCESERKPLKLEGSSADNEDGRGDVDAGDVLRCQWARGLRGVGRHLWRSRIRVGVWRRRIGCH